jgi:hypothetical protein
MSHLKVTKSKPKEVKQTFMALIVSCLQALLLDNTWFKAWNITTIFQVVVVNLYDGATLASSISGEFCSAPKRQDYRPFPLIDHWLLQWSRTFIETRGRCVRCPNINDDRDIAPGNRTSKVLSPDRIETSRGETLGNQFLLQTGGRWHRNIKQDARYGFSKG